MSDTLLPAHEYSCAARIADSGAWRYNESMGNAVIFGVLLLAAALEAGGDALVRAGLHSQSSGGRRLVFLLAGALTLFLYGCVVNLPRWDFGRLLGAYVAAFFVMAQLISWLFFGQKPTLPILVGGALIVAGGLVISLWK